MNTVAESAYLFARIDASAITHNCRVLRTLTPSGCRMCVAIKSNAYGHGVAAVLPALRAADVEMLCVASVDEARELVDFEWDRPILLLGSELSAYRGGEKEQIARWLVQHEVRVTAMRGEDVEILLAAADSLQKQAIVHFMFDSGMCRMGLTREDLLTLLLRFGSEDRLHVEGLYTHLATADAADKAFAHRQLHAFTALIAELKSKGINVPLLHCANSGAAIDIPESHFDMIRPGISVYGYHSGEHMHHKPDIRPAMQVVSALTLVKRIPGGSLVGYGSTYTAEKDMTIGIVPIGYADGYDRRLSNTGKMCVEGRTVPVIGRVSMDQTIVDLTPLVSNGVAVAPGHEVIVIDNARERANSVESLARLLDTIPYEIVTRLTSRIKRVQA
ncbi:MAG: alanine racemase [Lentisphaerae bacterium]|nr:alanine racemase [Lentisphaerota bacterium]